MAMNEDVKRLRIRELEEQERKAFAAQPDKREDVLVWESVAAWPAEHGLGGVDSHGESDLKNASTKDAQSKLSEHEEPIERACRSYIETPQDEDEGLIWEPYLAWPDD